MLLMRRFGAFEYTYVWCERRECVFPMSRKYYSRTKQNKDVFNKHDKITKLSKNECLSWKDINVLSPQLKMSSTHQLAKQLMSQHQMTIHIQYMMDMFGIQVDESSSTWWLWLYEWWHANWQENILNDEKEWENSIKSKRHFDVRICNGNLKILYF